MAFDGLRCDHGLIGLDEGGNNLEELSEENDNESTVDDDESGKWNLVQRTSKKRKGKAKQDEVKRVRNDVKVVIRFQTPCTINPLKVSEAIYKQVGEVRSVRTLKDGNLLVVCQDRDQRMGLMKLKALMGKSVKAQDWEERDKIMVVISGVSTNLSEDDVKNNVKGVRINKVKRLPILWNGTKGPSLSVLLILDEVKMPERIMIGYVSYLMRPYIPPPIRCFKCQRYGHIASACKSKTRCAKCGGEHEYGKCEKGTKIKCCNCGGEHSAAYKGCEMHKRAVQVQNVKVKESITYAEAIKKVDEGNQEKSRVKVGMAPVDVPPNQVQTIQKCCKVSEDTLIVDKKNFIAFMVEVVNCSAQVTSRSDRIKIIKKAAGKYLDIHDLSVDSIHNMVLGVSDSQASCGS